MKILAEQIVDILQRKGIIPVQRHNTYVYGFELLIYTLVSTFALFAIGCLLSIGKETAVLIFVFYLNQSNGGGFHAKTHFRCFLTMLSGFILFFSLSPHIAFCQQLQYFTFALSSTILWRYPLVLHPCKQYLSKRSPSLIHRYKIILTLQCLAYFLLSVFFPYSCIAQSFPLSLALSAFSRLVSALQPGNLVCQTGRPC